MDRFVFPDTAQKELYPYRKRGLPCRARGTKRLGSAINFYRQKVNGQLTDSLDEARKQSETLLFASGKRSPSSISKCIFDQDFIPDSSDRLHLAAAAAFIFCGSPVQINNTAMNLLLFHQIEAFNWFNTPEAASHYRNHYGTDSASRLAEDRQAFLKGNLFIDVGEENWKQLGFSAFELEKDILDILHGMTLTIVDCHFRCFFLTSDNPVVHISPSESSKMNDEVWFPISYNRALLWSHRPRMERERLGYSETRVRNRQIIKYSYKFIYSPRPEQWIESAVREEPFDPMFGHYGSLEKVIEGARPAYASGHNKIREIVDLGASMKLGERFDFLRI